MLRLRSVTFAAFIKHSMCTVEVAIECSEDRMVSLKFQELLLCWLMAMVLMPIRSFTTRTVCANSGHVNMLPVIRVKIRLKQKRAAYSLNFVGRIGGCVEILAFRLFHMNETLFFSRATKAESRQGSDCCHFRTYGKFKFPIRVLERSEESDPLTRSLPHYFPFPSAPLPVLQNLAGPYPRQIYKGSNRRLQVRHRPQSVS